MKKNLAKTLAVSLSAVLCMTTAMSAFAAPPQAPGGSGFGGGANTMTYDYSGTLAASLTADAKSVASDGEILSSSDSDVNVALAQNGGVLDVTNSTLTKSGSDNDGDNCNFYGINSILLSTGEDSMAYISSSKLSADSTGSNAIFATDGATVYSYNNDIATSSDNSRGFDATYGGTIIADSTDITTQGDHCAALATDRGGGSVSLTNSDLTTNGSGSPLLYSTGDIEVDNVNGTSSGSQLVGMEGLNTVLIYNSNLSSTITGKTASDPVANGIIIYQSTSGDAETTTGETATFNAVNSTLSSSIESGTMFYITNTTANVVLKNSSLNFDSDNVNLLTIEGNSSNNWGTEGSNGGTVTFTALGETLSGDISVDTISSLDLYLLDSTSYTGSTSITENSVNTSKTDSPVTVNVDSSSKWVVTENSTVTNLNVENGGQIVDENGNTVSVVANGETVVSGNSDITITVTGEYSNKVTTSDSNELSSDFIDRSDFDSHYGIETTFSTNASAPASEEVQTTQISATNDKSSSPVSSAWYFLIAGIVILIIIAVSVTVSKKNKIQE